MLLTYLDFKILDFKISLWTIIALFIVLLFLCCCTYFYVVFIHNKRNAEADSISKASLQLNKDILNYEKEIGLIKKSLRAN